MEDNIEQFYIATLNSLYLVDCKEDQKVKLTKVFSRKEGEKNDVVGECELGGISYLNAKDHDSLADHFFVLYEGWTGEFQHEKRAKAGFVSTKYWSYTTSNIVGLFLEKEDADKCMKAENCISGDPRWKEESAKTQEAIGNNHPTIIFDF